MHQHNIRLFLLQHLIQAHHSPGGNIKQCLASGHNIQIIIWFNMKKIQYLIQHIAMLGSNSHYRLNLLRMFGQLQHYRSHFNCFRTGTKHSHYFNLFPHLNPLPHTR